MYWAGDAFKHCTWPASRSLALGLATIAHDRVASVDPDRLRKLGARLGLDPAETADALTELIEGQWLVVDHNKLTARLNIPRRTNKKDE